jgi:hypothetical protein
MCVSPVKQVSFFEPLIFTDVAAQLCKDSLFYILVRLFAGIEILSLCHYQVSWCETSTYAICKRKYRDAEREKEGRKEERKW